MTCWLCGGATWRTSFEARERMLGLGEAFRYAECATCGTLQIEAVPADLGRFYPAALYYSLSASPPEGGVLKRVARLVRDEHALFGRGGALGAWLEARFPSPELRSIGAVRGLRRDMRIVDVGSGAGTLVRMLRARGFRSVLGLDPFVEKDLEHPDGVRVLKRDVRAIEGEWDLVMFHHSFEHVADPAGAIAACARHLSPEGQVLLRIPIVPNEAFARYGDRWVGLDAPRHVFVPSLEGLRRVGESAGLRVRAVTYDSTEFQFWASEQYVRDVPLLSEASFRTNPRAFPRAQIARWRLEAARLNRERRGDQAVVTLGR